MTDEELDALEKRLGPLDVEYSTKIALIQIEIGQETRDAFQAKLAMKLPDYNRATMDTLYPDIKSEEQARLAYRTLHNIQMEDWRSPDATPERVITNTLRRMSKDEIAALPPSMRLELLNVMNANIMNEVEGGDHDYINKQRFRLALGYDPEDMQKIAPVQFDARRSLSYSPALANWQAQKEDELKQKEEALFKENPDLKDIKDRWEKAPGSVTEEEKTKLVEKLHEVHAQTFGYPVATIVSTDLGGLMAKASDLKFGDSIGLIEIDPKRFGPMGYNQARNLIMHESDHLAQASWTRYRHDLPAGDPRLDFVNRAAAFSCLGNVGPMTSFLGLSVEGTILYHAKPQETHAHLLHDPANKKSDTPEKFPEEIPCLPGICP